MSGLGVPNLHSRQYAQKLSPESARSGLRRSLTSDFRQRVWGYVSDSTSQRRGPGKEPSGKIFLREL